MIEDQVRITISSKDRETGETIQTSHAGLRHWEKSRQIIFFEDQPEQTESFSQSEPSTKEKPLEQSEPFSQREPLEQPEPLRQTTMSSQLSIDHGVGTVRLLRQGEIRTEMFFQKGCRYSGEYGTPYGAMPMEINTDELELCEKENGCTVLLRYRLSMGNMMIADNEMIIGIVSDEFGKA